MQTENNYQIGLEHKHGLRNEKNVHRAFEFFKLAADPGNLNAQTELGLICYGSAELGSCCSISSNNLYNLHYFVKNCVDMIMLCCVVLQLNYY